MFDDRLDELEETYDRLRQEDENAARNLGVVLDRIEDGLPLAPGHVEIVERYLED